MERGEKMITTVTLNPSIDREYFVENHKPENDCYVYDNKNLKVSPGGKGLMAAINLKKLGYPDVQNMGFVGGRQGLFFEKMVQEYRITTNYVYTENEIRNNIKIIGEDPVTYTQFNDYTYKVSEENVEEFIRRFKRGINDSDLILMAGSIPEGVGFDIYKRLIRECNKQDKNVFLQASGEALKQALDEKPKIVSIYFKHTHKILDKEVKTFDDYVEMGKEIINRGVDHVIIPFHSDRLLFTKDEVYCLSPLNFCLRNWLGAGDAYTAAFFDYYYKYGFEFVEANRRGAAAALSIAENNFLFLKDEGEIEQNMDRIIVKQLEGY